MHHVGVGHLLLPRGEHRRGGDHEVEEWRDQPVGWMRRELGFHPAQTDRRQLLYRLPYKGPSSANQIARCSFEESHPPFFNLIQPPCMLHGLRSNITKVRPCPRK